MPLVDAFIALSVADASETDAKSIPPIELHVLGGLRESGLSKFAKSEAWRARLVEAGFQLPAVVIIGTYLLLLWSGAEARAQAWFLPALLVVALTLGLQWARHFAPELRFNRSAWTFVASQDWQVFITGTPFLTKRYVVVTDGHIGCYGETGRCLQMVSRSSIDSVFIDHHRSFLLMELAGQDGSDTILRLDRELAIPTTGLAFRSRNEPTYSTLISSGRFIAAGYSPLHLS
jgi:hypothetical protein